MVHLLILASSAVELVYEVLWMRRFTVLFGGTAPAAAVTLSAIFLGMAAGSAAVGRLAGRWKRTMRAFAVLQLGMAVGAVLLEPLLRAYEVFLTAFYPVLTGRPGAFLAVRGALALAAVALPAFFMGGVLPLAGQALASRGKRLGTAFAGLCAASLLGACGGTLLVPAVLLPLFGANGSYLAAIGVNLALAVLAALLVEPQPSAAACRTASIPGEPQTPDRFHLCGRLSLAFLSGALVMGLEVLWTRMFSMVHESSVYSFAAVLAVFLLGLAGGAWLSRWLLSRGLAPWRAAAWAWSAAGLLVLASPRVFQAITSGMAYASGGGGWGPVTGRTILLATVVLLPVAVLAGVVLPSLVEGARDPRQADESAGWLVGRLLAWNTAGAIAGPLLAAFVTGPRLGLWWSVTLIGVLLAVGGQAAAWVLAPDAPWGSGRRVAWPRLVLAAGATVAAVLFADPGGVPRARWDEARGHKLLGIIEGTSGTLAVLQDDSSRWITFNNHYTLGGTASAGDERQQGHLPLLLHPSPRAVAFLGLGTGITAGVALLYPVDSVTVLEILPEAVEAARDYFGHANYRIVEDPRAEVIVEDARAFLKASGRRFDVIVGDLVTPWRPGEASLYSLEHFQAARRALEPGGIFCQWLPLFQLTEEGFGIVAATFLDVFPGATLWRGDFLPDQPALALIGTVEPGSGGLDAAAADARVRELAPKLDHANPYLADPAGFWLFLVGPLDGEDPRFASARRNRDARPWIELLSPFTQRGSAAEPGASPLVGRRLEAAIEGIQKRPLEGTWLERLSPEQARWREAGAALWHASLLAREQSWEESRALSQRTLALLPEKLQLAVAGRVVGE